MSCFRARLAPDSVSVSANIRSKRKRRANVQQGRATLIENVPRYEDLHSLRIDQYTHTQQNRLRTQEYL